eukprot:Ihof_evm1s260 gene=Ihof_evmTU1s260
MYPRFSDEPTTKYVEAVGETEKLSSNHKDADQSCADTTSTHQYKSTLKDRCPLYLPLRPFSNTSNFSGEASSTSRYRFYPSPELDAKDPSYLFWSSQHKQQKQLDGLATELQNLTIHTHDTSVNPPGIGVGGNGSRSYGVYDSNGPLSPPPNNTRASPSSDYISPYNMSPFSTPSPTYYPPPTRHYEGYNQPQPHPSYPPSSGSYSTFTLPCNRNSPVNIAGSLGSAGPGHLSPYTPLTPTPPPLLSNTSPPVGIGNNMANRNMDSHGFFWPVPGPGQLSTNHNNATINNYPPHHMYSNYSPPIVAPSPIIPVPSNLSCSYDYIDHSIIDHSGRNSWGRSPVPVTSQQVLGTNGGVRPEENEREREDGRRDNIQYSQFYALEIIGQGGFGTVYKANWLDNQVVALKKVMTQSKDIQTEAALHATLRHPNIIRYHGTCFDDNRCFCIVTEYADYGALYQHIHSPSTNGAVASLKPNTIINYAMQIADGMNYLHTGHDTQIIHRDLKSQNVLVCGPPGNFTLKICDFGTARTFNHTTKMTLAGTFSWIAPEVLRGEACSVKCDVYSFGVVVWEMLTGLVPFSSMEQMAILWHVTQGGVLPIPDSTPLPFKELLDMCWKAPNQRPMFSSLLATLQSMRDIATLGDAVDTFHKSAHTWNKLIADSYKKWDERSKKWGGDIEALEVEKKMVAKEKEEVVALMVKLRSE